MANGGRNMNSIDPDPSQRLAAELFDLILVPLALARQARGEPAYFPADREKGATSYFSPLPARVRTADDLELPGDGTAEQLIEALATFWQRSGDPDLCCLIPAMKEIAHALQGEAVENDGTVSVFCYAMF